ncbi:uncharacterized protein LOC126176056 [Schistocerca cancellata]|uniref:uncharacterized protein LOC126176056 n=1 Tax=Schistocerca cancellata TaxID=274614 RepID=UPI0021191836|nr:uncharacterized protein LOC126176056 [Schistocerca cancellata]
MMRYRLLWAPLVALLVVVVAVVLGAATPATKRVLVDIAVDGDDGDERIEAIETDDPSQDDSGEISDEEAQAEIEDDDEDAEAPAGAWATVTEVDAKPTSASERLSFLSGAAARVAKVWHAAASGKRLPRFRDARTHKIAKAARPPDTARELDRERDNDHASVYVLDDPLVVEGYAAPAGAAPGVVSGHAGPLPADDDDPMLLQGHAHHAATAYLEAGVEPDLELLYVRHRLQKLDFYFEFLKVMSEDCRQRMLCEVSKEPSRFYPLSSVLEDATSFSGSYQYVTSHLINTTEGARLLSYMEASYRGQDRGRSCAVFQYRCPAATEEMINYDALCLWREMVRWLTIHIVAPNN